MNCSISWVSEIFILVEYHDITKSVNFSRTHSAAAERGLGAGGLLHWRAKENTGKRGKTPVKKVKILVVDNDESLLNFLRLYLEAQDYEPLLAASAAEALEIVS